MASSGKRAFDLARAKLNIHRRLIRPRHLQTYGRVGRFNGQLSELGGQTRFASAAQLESMLTHDLATYNHRMPPRAQKHQTPHPSRQSLAQTAARFVRQQRLGTNGSRRLRIT